MALEISILSKMIQTQKINISTWFCLYVESRENIDSLAEGRLLEKKTGVNSNLEGDTVRGKGIQVLSKYLQRIK